MHVDFLIVGQGLAGSLLAFTLIERGYKVIVVDAGLENASHVAAGLINPITGMRFVKTIDVDTLLPTAKAFYRKLEALFGQVFYVEKPMLRIFQHEKERHHCRKRLQDAAYQAYLADHIETSNAFDGLRTAFGSIVQKQTAYLLTHPLLSCLKQFFIEQGSYRLSNVQYHDIKLSPLLQWQDIIPQRIIFCEGYHAVNNPWFADLPFQAAKGEILSLAIDQVLPDAILNFGNWLIPLGSNNIRVGASFDTINLDTQPTQSAKQALFTQFNKLNLDLARHTVFAHQAGIRPCTLDKQPFIGSHPAYPQLSIFNGFGAKGSLLIPWHSLHFADVLANTTRLSAHCAVARYCIGSRSKTSA